MIKRLVKFISENGGEVFESELRKKFLQPRTTMWRAVKRLERQGVIEIYKKDLQNMVKLRKIWRKKNEKISIFALLNIWFSGIEFRIGKMIHFYKPKRIC